MKFTCDRAEFSSAVNLAATIALSKSPRRILEHILLRASKASGVEVFATDLEVSIRVSVEHADIEAPGEALIPASRAVPICKEIAGDKVALSTGDDDRVTRIACGGSTFKVCGDDPTDFPEFPAGIVEGMNLDRSKIQAMMRKTAFASAAQASKNYALNGVLFEVGHGVLRLVATDGKRLAINEAPLEAASQEVRAIIPNKAVNLLTRLGTDDDKTIAFRFSEHQVFASVPRVTVAAQTVQGHFPPYDGVLPKNFAASIDLEAAPFLAVLRQAALLSTKDSRAVRLSFTHNKITMSSRVPDVGESTIEAPIAFSSDPVEIAFDPAFLSEAVKAVEGERFMFDVKSPAAPAVVREGDFRCVVMPITIA